MLMEEEGGVRRGRGERKRERKRGGGFRAGSASSLHLLPLTLRRVGMSSGSAALTMAL